MKLIKTFDKTILVALIAFFGTFLGYIFDGYSKTKQQEKEFESTIIINAISTGNTDESKKNLKFLIDADLITDKSKRIGLLKIIKDSNYIIPNKNRNSNVFQDSVFICNNTFSKKYHKSVNCRYLLNCNNIIKVSIYDAIKKFDKNLCLVD